LVSGINIAILAAIKHFIMSAELEEFSEMIDDQFEIADIETSDELWGAVLNLFI
jgi:hypothetical protein